MRRRRSSPLLVAGVGHCRRRSLRLIWPLGLLLAALVPFLLPPTFATFVATTANGSNGFQASTLQPPSNLIASQTCSSGIPSGKLTWTATPSAFAAGYSLTRVGGPTSQITPATTTTANDGPLTNNTSYTWRLSAFYGNWTTSAITASLTPNCPPASVGAPSVSSGPVGSIVTITGSNFAPSTPLTVTFGTTAATITSGGTSAANGDVSATFTVPFSGNGSYAIKVSDGTSTAASSSSFTVTGSFDGVMFTAITANNQDCSTATVSTTTTCTAAPLGGTGSFTGSVTFVTAARTTVTNAGPAVTVISSETTVRTPGGTVTPSSSTIANGATTSTAAFKLTGDGTGWKATMTCSVTVNGQTFSVAVTGN